MPANFREPCTGVVLRTTLPRTRVNEGKKEGRGCYVPALPELCYLTVNFQLFGATSALPAWSFAAVVTVAV